MPGPLQTISVDWTGVRQDRDDQKLGPGDLTALVNYRRDKEGQLSKRYGHDRTVLATFQDATFAGPAVAMEAGDRIVVRDSSDQLFAYDSDSETSYYRGANHRAHPRWFEVENRANNGGARKPLHVKAGDDLWEFSLGVSVSSVDAYQLTVLDPETSTVKLETTPIQAAGITAYAVTVDSVGRPWLFFVDGSGNIKAHRFDAVTSSPTSIDYYSSPGTTWTSIDAVADPSEQYIYVVATGSQDSGGDRVSTLFRSYILISDTAATATDVSTTTCSGGAGVEATSGASILVHDFADGFYSFAYSRNKDSDPGKLEVYVERVAKTVPATTTVTKLGEVSVSDNYTVPAFSGNVDPGTGDLLVFGTVAQLFGSDTSFVSKNKLTVTPYRLASGIVTVGDPWRSAWIASKPFLVGDNWHVLTGFDDGDNTGSYTDPSQGIQNGFFVRRLDGTLVTSVLDGEAGFAFFGAPAYDGIHYGTLLSSHVVTPVALSATEVAFPLLNIGLVRNRPGLSVAVVDFDPVYFSDVPGLVPGMVQRVGSKDRLSEVSPIHSPYSRYAVESTSGLTVSTNYVAFLYKLTDSTGRVYRSAPLLRDTAEVFANSTLFPRLTLPTCRHSVGGTIEIEVYGSPNNEATLYLQDSVLNDATVDTVDLTIVPSQWTAKTEGEILYTTGGGLPNISPEPARLVWKQGARTLLGATPSGDIWVSREQVAGLGQEFNPAYNFSWNEVPGELRAGIGLDNTTSVLFKERGIAVAQGNPDGRGQGGYTVSTISTDKGATNPAAVVKGPLGIYFPNSADGRMCVVSGGAVTEIHSGMESYRNYVWTAAVDCPAERCIRWFATNGKQLVLDYSKPTPESPAGTWVLYEGEGLPAAVGARLIDGLPTFVEAGDTDSTASWQPGASFLDDGTEVLTSMTSGDTGLVGFGQEFDSDWVTIHSTYRGGDSTFEYVLIPDSGVEEVHPDAANDSDDVAFRSGCYRTRKLKVRIDETSATGEGRAFHGMTIAVRPYGRVKKPYRQIG